MSSAPVPTDKFDLAALHRARAMGFPALDPHIPALLEWLQDPNWPVFHTTVDLLADAGPALLAPLRAVFDTQDADWIEAILSNLIPRLPPELHTQLALDVAALTPQEHP